MIHAWLLILVTLTFGADFALAGAPPFLRKTVDLRRIEYDLTHESADSLVAKRRENYLGVVEQTYALRVSEYRAPGDLEAARIFSRLLFSRDGAMVWLHASIRGQAIPAFNGRLFDTDLNFVANLKMVRISTYDNLVKLVAARVDRAIALSDPVGWREYQMRHVRVLAGLPGDAEVFMLGLTPAQMKRYHFMVWNTRRMIEIFAPGSERDSWIMLSINGDQTLPPAQLNEIAQMTLRSPRVPVIIIQQTHQMITFSAGQYKVEPLRSCQTALAPSEVGVRHEFKNAEKFSAAR